MAVDLEPDHANANGYLSLILTLQGDFERARFHAAEQVRLGNGFGNARLVYIDILVGDLVKARQTVEKTIVVDSETRQRLTLLIDALEDSSLIPTYLEQIKQTGHDQVDHWQITQELFLLGQYEEAIRLEDNGPSLRMSWADFWSDVRSLPEFEQTLESNTVYSVWDELGPPPMCRNTGQSYDCGLD